MKVHVELKGDLLAGVQRVSKFAGITYEQTVLMLTENGFIKFTETMEEQLIDEDKIKAEQIKKNKWYRKLFSKLFRRNK